MSGIGAKKTPKGAEKESIEELEKEFKAVTDRIRAILNGRKDRSQLDLDEKRELRLQYFKASTIAKQIADRCTDDAKAEEYNEYYKKLSAKAESYGSAAKSYNPTVTLDDVKGLNDVKELVKTFLFMAQNPQIMQYYKIKGGLGMLMYGAPGTGKTMIAEAIANAMKLPLFIVTPADIFKSYVGESEQSVKQLFQEIELCKEGAILFVDECESIFSKRSSDTKDYKAAVTNELLQRINGFGVDGSKRILIGATNRPDMIDPAYLRYKRFSHLIHVTPPDAEAKRAIIESKLEGIPLDGISVDDVLFMSTVACGGGYGGEPTGYYSAADICGIIEEACRIAMERLIASNSTTPIPLTREMFEKAFNKIKPSISSELLKEYDSFRENIND